MYTVYQSGWAELYGGQKYPECQWLKAMKVVLSFHATRLFWVGGVPLFLPVTQVMEQALEGTLLDAIAEESVTYTHKASTQE